MTPLLWGRVLIAALCASTALWVHLLMRRRRRGSADGVDEQTRRVLWILLALATALTLGIDPLGRRLGGLIGQPYLPEHLKHLFGLVAAVNALGAVESIRGTTSRYRPPSRTARLRHAWPLVAALMFVLYRANDDRLDMLEMRAGLGGWTGTAYWLVFLGYFLAACGPFTAQCLQYVSESRSPTPLRSGILFLGVGGFLSCVYAVNKIWLVGTESGEVFRVVALTSSRLAVILSFSAICYGVWRSRATAGGWWLRWTESVAKLTRARTLLPMTRALSQAIPGADVHLGVVAPALVLATRENTTRDAIADLVGWMDPQDGSRIQQVLARQRDDEALVLATSIELARRRMLDGLPPIGGPTAPQADDGPFLQRLATQWPDALDLADVVEGAARSTVAPSEWTSQTDDLEGPEVPDEQ